MHWHCSEAIQDSCKLIQDRPLTLQKCGCISLPFLHSPAVMERFATSLGRKHGQATQRLHQPRGCISPVSARKRLPQLYCHARRLLVHSKSTPRLHQPRVRKKTRFPQLYCQARRLLVDCTRAHMQALKEPLLKPCLSDAVQAFSKVVAVLKESGFASAESALTGRTAI